MHVVCMIFCCRIPFLCPFSSLKGEDDFGSSEFFGFIVYFVDFSSQHMYWCSKIPEFCFGILGTKNTSNGRVLLKSRVTVTRYASTSILVIPCRTSRIFILSLTYSNLASNPCRETCGKTIVVGTCGKWMEMVAFFWDEN